MSKRAPSSGNADRQRQFRETARELLHRAKVKHQYGEAADTAGTLARAMEQAYRMGFEDALKGPAASEREPPTDSADGPRSDALEWTLIPPRTRSTFWSICLAALGRDGRTHSASYFERVSTRRGTLAWQLVVPDRHTVEKSVGDGTIVTLLRLGLLQNTNDDTTVTLTDYGIKTWHRFCERGGQWPDDLVEKLP